MGIINLPVQAKVGTVMVVVTAEFITPQGQWTSSPTSWEYRSQWIPVADEKLLDEHLVGAQHKVKELLQRADRRNIRTTVQFMSVEVPIEEVLPVGRDTTITWTT